MGEDPIVKILACFGFVTRPRASFEAMIAGLSAGVPAAEIGEGTLRWLVPSAKVEAFRGLLAVRCPAWKVAETAEVSGDRRELTLTAPAPNAYLPALAVFLKSGLAGAFFLDGFAYAYDPEFYELCQPLRTEPDPENDIAVLSSLRVRLPDDALLANHSGKLLQGLDRIAEAAGAFRRAAELNPSYGEPYSNLGVLLWGAGKRPEAFAMFREAFIRSPYETDIQDNFIHAGFETGELARMRATLDRAAGGHPLCSGLGYLRAVLSSRLGDNEEAKMHLRTALSDDPGDAHAKELLDRLEAGHAPSETA